MWIAILFCFMNAIAAEDEHGPINTAVVAGNPMSMVCDYNSIGSSIQWTYKNPDALGESSVFDGSHTFSGFTVDIAMHGFSREVTLIKNYTQMEDAGIYKCLVIQKTRTIIRTAQLIVLASEPKCGTNTSDEDNGVLEGTFLTMWCKIGFSGDFAPVMKWSRNDGKEFDETVRNRNGQMSYEITKELKAEDNGKTYSCTTYFLPINSTVALQEGVTRASNAPSYRCQWNFTVVVWIRPKNLHVEPLKESYSYGNRLRCLSDGDATIIGLTYRWVSVATGTVTYGSDLFIDDTMTQNVLHVYECIADHKKSNTTISKTVNITISAHGFNKTTLLAILLPIGGVVIALNLGLILQKRHIRRNALEMARRDQSTAHHYEEVDDSVVKSMTTEMTTAEPTTTTAEEAITIGDDEHPQETVSQVLSTRPYSKLEGVRPLPETPVYSTLDTTSTSTQEIERARDSPTIEVHYVNVPMRETTYEDPVYMELADND